MAAEQAQIESRLVELVGMENLQTKMQQTSIQDDVPMKVDSVPQYRAIGAKQRALAKYVRRWIRIASLKALLTVWSHRQRTFRKTKVLKGSHSRKPYASSKRHMRQTARGRRNARRGEGGKACLPLVNISVGQNEISGCGPSCE